MTQNPFAGVEGEYERRMRLLREQQSAPEEVVTTPPERKQPEPKPNEVMPERERERVEPKERAEPERKVEPVVDPEPQRVQERPRTETEIKAEPKPEQQAQPQDHGQPVVSASLSRQRARGEFRINPGVNSAVKPVPTSLIAVLKERLAGHACADYSQDRLVVGYLTATLGLPADELDAKTQEVVLAFRKEDPMLAMMGLFEAALNKQSNLLERMNEAAGSTRMTSDVIELGLAYLLAERTGTLDTIHSTPENLDMTQRKVIGARDRARNQAMRQVSQEKATKGRPFR